MIPKNVLEMLRKDWRTAIGHMEAIQRVRNLHSVSTFMGGIHCCDAGCEGGWPCPTIRALDGEV